MSEAGGRKSRGAAAPAKRESGKREPVKREPGKPAERKREPRETVQQRVYDELRRSLMIGAFMPGQKVSLRFLASSLGTSLMPIREAVNRLVAERALDLNVNRSITVPVVTKKKFEEIVHWRRELEGAATEQACERMDRKTLNRIKKLNASLKKALKSGERSDILERNWKFHFEIYNASESTVLLPMIESLWLQAGPFTYFSLPSPKTVWDGSFHEEIIDALEAGDCKRARKALVGDIASISEFLSGSALIDQTLIKRVAAPSKP